MPVSGLVGVWSSNPEDAGSIPSRKALHGVAFFATGPGLGLIVYILTTLEFPTHYFDIHICNHSRFISYICPPDTPYPNVINYFVLLKLSFNQRRVFGENVYL